MPKLVNNFQYNNYLFIIHYKMLSYFDIALVTDNDFTDILRSLNRMLGCLSTPRYLHKFDSIESTILIEICDEICHFKLGGQ